MPLLRPEKEESKQAFVSRFMKNDQMQEDFPEKENRVGVANSQWKKVNPTTNKSSETTREFKSVKLSVNFAATRNETFRGKPHIVVPMIMINEGVLNGILYPGNELGKFTDSWNTRPIPIRHPEDEDGDPVSAGKPFIIDNETVGEVFNTYFESGKLKAEAWLDIEKLDKVPNGKEVKERIARNQMIEISTGLFLDKKPSVGTFKGKQYTHIACNYRPDHLAILLSEKGASSIADGSGLNRNKDQSSKNPDKETKMDKKKVIDGLVANTDFTDEDRPMLEGMDDKALARLVEVTANKEEEEESKEPKKVEPKAEPKKEEKVEANKSMTAKEVMEIATNIATAQIKANAVKEKKDPVLARLEANKACTLSKATLEKMDPQELLDFETSITPNNYQGRQIGRPSVGEEEEVEPMETPTVNFEKVK